MRLSLERKKERKKIEKIIENFDFFLNRVVEFMSE